MKKKSFIGRESGKPFVARDGALIYELFKENGVKIKNMSLASGLLRPGQKALPHFHRKTEEVYYILSGSGQVRVGDKIEEIASGAAVYVPANKIHALLNTHPKKPMKVLAICSPKYLDKDMFFT